MFLMCSNLDKILNQINSQITRDQIFHKITIWRHAGHRFAFTTSESRPTIERLMPEWRSQADYLITHSGSAIYTNDGSLMHACALSHKLVNQIQHALPDKTLPVYYGLTKIGSTTQLDDTLIRVRLWFDTGLALSAYQQYLEEQGWPIKIISQPNPSFSYNEPFGRIDLVSSEVDDCGGAQLLFQYAKLDPSIDQTVIIDDATQLIATTL